MISLISPSEVKSPTSIAIGSFDGLHAGHRQLIKSVVEENQFSKRADPRGDDYYWLAGEVVLDIKSKGYGPKNWPSDVSQIQDNKISLTPVEPDLFWRGNLDDLPKINNSFVNPS